MDNIYTKENIKLVEEIIKNNGLVISEYPLGTKPLKYHFPARNRIISGLSDSVLVVEARKNSGTNITVDFALEQGKDVFVVPGNIYSKTSDGTNFLITEGAIPVLSYNLCDRNKYLFLHRLKLLKYLLLLFRILHKIKKYGQNLYGYHLLYILPFFILRRIKLFQCI